MYREINDMKLRELEKNEACILKDFTYEAIYIPDGVEPPDRSIVDLPELRVYYEDFGSAETDCCIVCEDDGRIVGAVWTRIMDDYGHVDNETPSMAISLFREYRGKRIGSRLMTEMLETLKQQGYRQASLSVQKANYAVRMYRKLGFRPVRETPEEYIMVCDLPKAKPVITCRQSGGIF